MSTLHKIHLYLQLAVCIHLDFKKGSINSINWQFHDLINESWSCSRVHSKWPSCPKIQKPTFLTNVSHGLSWQPHLVEDSVLVMLTVSLTEMTSTSSTVLLGNFRSQSKLKERKVTWQENSYEKTPCLVLQNKCSSREFVHWWHVQAWNEGWYSLCWMLKKIHSPVQQTEPTFWKNFQCHSKLQHQYKERYSLQIVYTVLEPWKIFRNYTNQTC